MAKAQDYTKVMQDIMGAFPVDMTNFQDAFKAPTSFGEKMSKVALGAAEKSAEISTKWAKDTIAQTGNAAKAKEDPADYAKAMTDFASAQAGLISEHMAAFAEVAKKVQMDTVELVMAAGKDLSEDATSAVKKATGTKNTAASAK